MENLDRHEEYYKAYYHTTLGIRNWENHYNLYRKDEEAQRSQLFHKIESFGIPLTNKKILVVGAGTGAELFGLYQKCTKNVFGIEPDAKAYEILNIKAQNLSFPKNQILLTSAEKMPFLDNSFDVIICYSVLEHVRSVTQSLQEIIRILKPGAKAYISTPDYNYPYEGHYKQYAPTFLGRQITKLFLRFIGRNPSFCNTLNFVTKRSLDRILRSIKSISYLRVQKPYNQITPKNFKERVVSIILFIFDRVLNIQKNQEIIIIKNEQIST